MCYALITVKKNGKHSMSFSRENAKIVTLYKQAIIKPSTRYATILTLNKGTKEVTP